MKTLIFDLGGVIMTIDQLQAVSRFKERGVQDIENYLDPYTQQGIFGDLEGGLITAEQFRDQLNILADTTLTYDDCAYCWQGYRKEVPYHALNALRQLRSEGYRLLLLSNTNPFMMQWAESPDFDGEGNPVSSYFDAMYLSYKMKLLKPNPDIFKRLLQAEHLQPNDCIFIDDGPRNIAVASQLGINTLMPQNGEDWLPALRKLL